MRTIKNHGGRPVRTKRVGYAFGGLMTAVVAGLLLMAAMCHESRQPQRIDVQVSGAGFNPQWINPHVGDSVRFMITYPDTANFMTLFVTDEVVFGAKVYKFDGVASRTLVVREAPANDDREFIYCKFFQDADPVTCPSTEGGGTVGPE